MEWIKAKIRENLSLRVLKRPAKKHFESNLKHSPVKSPIRDRNSNVHSRRSTKPNNNIEESSDDDTTVAMGHHEILWTSMIECHRNNP